jgi:hypothetical protein
MLCLSHPPRFDRSNYTWRKIQITKAFGHVVVEPVPVAILEGDYHCRERRNFGRASAPLALVGLLIIQCPARKPDVLTDYTKVSLPDPAKLSALLSNLPCYIPEHEMDS